MIMNGEEDDRMSASGSKRESSVLVSVSVQRPGRRLIIQDWYMKDRWQGGGSPSARAASSRLGSVGPAGSSSGMPPIRKGQFVWDSEKGFVREHELKAGRSSSTLSHFAISTYEQKRLKTYIRTMPSGSSSPSSPCGKHH